MISKQTVLTIIVICISFIFINISGILYDIYDHTIPEKKNPLFWSLAIAFSSAGGVILLRLVTKKLLLENIINHMDNIKN